MKLLNSENEYHFKTANIQNLNKILFADICRSQISITYMSLCLNHIKEIIAKKYKFKYIFSVYK